MCLTSSPFKNLHVLDLAGAVSERCLGGVGWRGKGSVPWSSHPYVHFGTRHSPLISKIDHLQWRQLDVRPEAAWTRQTTGCPNGWVAVLIFVMNVHVNILGEKWQQARERRNWPFSSRCIVYILVKRKVLTSSLFLLESCMSDLCFLELFYGPMQGG